MSAHNNAEDSILKAILQAVTWTSWLVNATSSPFANVYVALHTADPGEAGTQATSETTYTGYARVAVVRTAGGWTVSSGSGSNAAVVTFGACTVGTPTITHFSLGSVASGATELIFSGALTASLAVSPGITPSFAIGALTVTAD